jgi:alcohol dehydrogenase YqhD (iron-dependent ADH family)
VSETKDQNLLDEYPIFELIGTIMTAPSWRYDSKNGIVDEFCQVLELYYDNEDDDYTFDSQQETFWKLIDFLQIYVAWLDMELEKRNYRSADTNMYCAGNEGNIFVFEDFKEDKMGK